MMDIFRQLPIPFKTTWDHNKRCFYCDRLGNLGRVLYDSEFECGVFVCQDCKITTSTFCDDVPMETEFKNKHKCDGLCRKPSNIGVMTYCPNCEDVEFVCPNCYKSYFEKMDELVLDERYYEPDMSEKPNWEEFVMSCAHVINNERPVHITDPVYHNTMIAVCKECADILENPEEISSGVDINQIFSRIESRKLKL